MSYRLVPYEIEIEASDSEACANLRARNKASETIYIWDDGSVENTDKIQRDGDIYAFADNSSETWTIQDDNTVSVVTGTQSQQILEVARASCMGKVSSAHFFLSLSD